MHDAIHARIHPPETRGQSIPFRGLKMMGRLQPPPQEMHYVPSYNLLVCLTEHGNSCPEQGPVEQASPDGPPSVTTSTRHPQRRSTRPLSSAPSSIATNWWPLPAGASNHPLRLTRRLPFSFHSPCRPTHNGPVRNPAGKLGRDAGTSLALRATQSKMNA